MHTRSAVVDGGVPRPGRPAVVLIHGLGMSGRSLVPTLRLLAPELTVLAPDLPGFGRSSRPARPLHLPELADALVDWMDAVALPRAALLGHSLGCQVALHVADRHPDRVVSLVLASPSRDPGAPSPWQQALRLVLDAPRESPGLLPIAISDYLRAGPRRMWLTLRESLSTDATDRLRRTVHPTLVVRGSRDTVVSDRWARSVTALLPAGRLVVLPGAPHGLPYSSARLMADCAGPFLIAHGG